MLYGSPLIRIVVTVLVLLRADMWAVIFLDRLWLLEVRLNNNNINQ